MIRTLINPLILIYVVSAFVFTLREFGGIDYPELSGETVIFYILQLLIFSICFIVSFFLSRPWPAAQYDSQTHEWLNKKVNKLYYISLFFSSIWLIFACLDSYSNIAALSQGITQARFNSIGSEIEGSFSGIIKHFTLGFPVVIAVISIIYREFLSKNKKRISSCIFIISILFGFIDGGRNPAFISLAMLFFAYLLSRSKQIIVGNKLLIRTKLLLFVGILLVFTIFITFFIERADLRGRDAYSEIDNIAYGFGEGGWVTEVNNPTPPLQIYTMFNFYITHAINEVNFAIERKDGPFYGALSFYLPAALLRKFGVEIPNINTLVSSLNKQGAYLGLQGSMYLDFGYYGAILIYGLIGTLSGFLYKKIKTGINPTTDLVGVWVLVMIALSYFYPIFSVGNGFSILSAIIACYVFSKLTISKEISFV